MRLSWPSSCSRTARLRTWSFTPPGDAKSYGENSPILVARTLPDWWGGGAPSGPDAARQDHLARHAGKGKRPERCSRRAGPDPMRHVPLLGVALDEPFDAPQKLFGCTHLVGARVAGRLRVDQGSPLCHVRIVRQPVHANRKERGAQAQRDRGGAERDGRQLAEKRHQVAGPGDVAVDRRDHHLLVAQSLQDLADTAVVERQDADPQPRPSVAIPLEERSRLQLLGEKADRRQRRRPDRRHDLVRPHVARHDKGPLALSASRVHVLPALHLQSRAHRFDPRTRQLHQVRVRLGVVAEIQLRDPAQLGGIALELRAGDLQVELEPRASEWREPPRDPCRKHSEGVSPGPWKPLDNRLHDLEGAPCPLAHPSATEHWPERIPLVGSLLDEILETFHHSLHQTFFGVLTCEGESGIEMDVILARRDRVLQAGTNAAPVLSAIAAGPPGTTAWRPKNRTGTPGPCSRSHSNATIEFAFSASVISRTAERPSMITFSPKR